MRNCKKVFLVLLSLILITMAIAGCSGNRKVVRVGSKEFTEQLLLGQITLQVLKDAGYTVVDRTGVAGSNKVRAALLQKEIDVYWEYTGTAWLSHLQNDQPITDPQECYDQVRQADLANGITWLPFAPFNNTYTIMMRKDQAQQLGISSISDLSAYLTANPGALTFAVDHEFTARADGLPGLQSTYQFTMPEENVIVMDNAIVYRALKENQADIGMGFSTDGRIQAFNLINLEDDLSFFPAYNPAPNLRTEFAEANPEIVELLAKVAALLDNDTITQMNYLVDIEQKTPAEVAQNWLKSAGLIQ